MADGLNLQPFDDETQELLFFADNISQVLADRLREHLQMSELRQEDVELDEDDKALYQLVKAYGILYNRALELGLIRGSVIVEKPE